MYSYDRKHTSSIFTLNIETWMLETESFHRVVDAELNVQVWSEKIEGEFYLFSGEVRVDGVNICFSLELSELCSWNRFNVSSHSVIPSICNRIMLQYQLFIYQRSKRWRTIYLMRCFILHLQNIQSFNFRKFFVKFSKN